MLNPADNNSDLNGISVCPLSPFGAILWHFWGYEASSGFCASILISGLILTCSVPLVGAVYDYGWTTFGLISSLRRGHLCRALPVQEAADRWTWVPQHIGLEPHSSESILSDMSLIFTIW